MENQVTLLLFAVWTCVKDVSVYELVILPSHDSWVSNNETKDFVSGFAINICKRAVFYKSEFGSYFHVFQDFINIWQLKPLHHAF